MPQNSNDRNCSNSHIFPDNCGANGQAQLWHLAAHQTDAVSCKTVLLLEGWRKSSWMMHYVYLLSRSSIFFPLTTSILYNTWAFMDCKEASPVYWKLGTMEVFIQKAPWCQFCFIAQSTQHGILRCSLQNDMNLIDWPLHLIVSMKCSIDTKIQMIP